MDFCHFQRDRLSKFSGGTIGRKSIVFMAYINESLFDLGFHYLNLPSVNKRAEKRPTLLKEPIDSF